MHTKPNNRPKRIVADMSRKVCEREADSDDSADSGHSMASMGAIKGVDSEQSLQQSSDAFTDAKQVPVAVPPGCIVCAWCAKVGIKLFTLNTPNGCKAFCSELCFTQCRRASFKKNKMCDWCKHVRHTVNYVDFQDGEQQLQFCSNKCLNQYKMNIFCNETKAHLHLSPGLVKEAAKINSLSKTSNLITPDLWLKDMKNGENDYNSVNVYKDDSDSECEVELDLDDSSKSTSGATKKRKLSSADFTKEDCELKPNDRPKDNDFLTKDKTKKELKRLKHSHKVSNSRHIGGKHSTQDLGQQNEWSLRDNNESSHSNFHPSYRQKSRHSPIPTSVASMRPTVTTNTGPSHPLPLLNGNSSMTPSRPNLQISPLAAGPSPPNKIASFPRLSANMSSSRVTPLLPSQPMSPRVPPLPSHLLGAAQLEAFARMQSSLGGLRPPMPPLGAHLTHGLPFLGLPHLNLNGVLPQNGSPLMPPSIPPHMSVPRQPYQNCPLLPPISVMTPYPVPILIPIPIPVPILFPVDKEAFLEPKCRDNDHNYNQQTNQNTGNDSTHTSHHSLANSSNSSASRVEAIVSKLKSKADCSQLISPSVDQSLDLRRITADSVSSSDESDNDESSESSPKNLIIKSR